METAKSIFLSKTFWFNLLAGIVAAATYIDPQLLSLFGIPEDKKVEVMALVGTVTGICNMILRKLSDKPVVLKKKTGTTVTFVLLMLCLAGLQGCAFVRDLPKHNSVQLTEKPANPDAQFSVVWKTWGTKDLVQKHAPTSTKFGKFMAQATEHCTLEIIEFPNDWNDTTAIQLTCDSTLSKFKSLVKKK